jgi:hypothetical protein
METVQVPILGGILLIDERKPDLSYRLVQEHAHSRRVLCLTREPPERVARRHPMENAEHWWLISGDGERSLSPYQLGAVRDRVEGFLRENPGGAVLIDGVELLMVMNSYDEVRDLLSGLHDRMLRAGGECVVPIDTRTLTTKELADMRRSFPMVRGDGQA